MVNSFGFHVGMRMIERAMEANIIEWRWRLIQQKNTVTKYRKESQKYAQMADDEEREMIKTFLAYFHEQGRLVYGYGIGGIDF